MKHLKNFKIFEERHSCPESVYDVSQELLGLIADETLKWKDGDRKDKSDYIFYSVKNQSDDFPIDRIKMKLIMTNTDKYGDFNCSGKSHLKGTNDPLLVPMIKTMWNKGKVDIGIEINILMSERADPTREEIIENTENLVIHEIFHSYQFYKKDLKTGKDMGNEFIHELSCMLNGFFEDFYHVPFLADLINLTYIHLEMEETSAHLAELHAKTETSWTDFYKEFKTMSLDEILNKCKRGVKESKESERKIVNKFVKDSGEIGADMSSIKTFKDLVEWLYTVVKNNQEYTTRKLGKILAYKAHNKKTSK